MNYWEECIRIAFEEAGIEASEDQILKVVSSIEGGHENYGMSHGYDCITNLVLLENTRLETELKKEKAKRVCPECGGDGRITSSWGVRSSNTQCHICHGEGKV